MISTEGWRHRGDPVFKLILQVEGQADVQQAGRQAPLTTPGDMTLIDGAQPFSIKANDRFRHTVVAIPRRLITSLARGIEYRTAQRHAGAGSPQLIADFLAAYTAADANLLPSQRHSAAMAVAYLIDGLHHRDVRSGTQVLLHRALQLIDQHLADARADQIAQRLGISRRYLDRIFETSGRTFSAHVWERRLSLAAHHLRNTPTPNITALAHALGFKDSSHFARAFRRRFGMSPTQWVSACIQDACG